MKFDVYQIAQLLIALIILGGIWFIFDQTLGDKLPPKVRMVLNVIVMVIAAIVGIRFLVSLL